ncbi:hypothetical protein ACFLW1_03450, partial [Chloroflexota bacterium]
KGPNVLLNVSTLYGFWREGYYDPRLFLPGWQLLFAFIVCVATYGFYRGLKGKLRSYVAALGLIAIVSLWLAIGTSSEITAGIYTFLYERLPFFSGMREPQKFAGTLVLAYAFLGGLGVACIADKVTGLSRIKPYLKKGFLVALALVIIAVPLLYTYPMLFGVKGQIGNAQYPQDWQETEEFLKADKADFNVLFLPWHNYMDFRWIGGNAANPATWFFTKPIIRGDNLELPGLYTQSTNPVSGYIEELLLKKQTLSNAGDILSPLRIKYIVLAKESDWPEYSFLGQQRDLELVSDSDNLQVYQNLAYTDPPSPVSQKAGLLGLDADAVAALETRLADHEAGSKAWLGYLISGLLFLGFVGYLVRRKVRLPALR